MRSNLTRWDFLKLAALLLMFIDHSGHFFLEDQEWIRGIGRACAPIFLFLVGFAPHYRFDKKLVVLALILTVSDWWVKGAPNTLNILWTIVIIRIILAWLESREKYSLRLHEWVIGSIALLPLVVMTQYGTLGMLFALSGYVYKHKNYYSTRTPEHFLLATTVLYGFAIAMLSQFQLLTAIIMAVGLLLMVRSFLWFVQAPTAGIPCPSLLILPLKLSIKYTALIYAVHIVILGWMTGKPM